MKKALLTFSIIVSGCFFVFAEFQVENVRVNVGKTCGTIDGKPFCINPSTGQWEISDGHGGGVGGNVNTGQVGAKGTIGGVGVSIGSGGNVTVGGVATGQKFGGIIGLVIMAQNILAMLVPILISLAVVAFFWYVVLFIWKGSSSVDEQKKAKSGMFWSVFAIFVMVSIWGIVTLIGSILGIGQGGDINGFRLPGEGTNQ